MKRRIAISAVIALIIVGLIISVIFFTQKRKADNDTSDTLSEDTDEFWAEGYICYPIHCGPMTSTRLFSATARMTEHAEGELTIPKDAEIEFSRGENVKKGEKLYTSGDNEINAEFNLKILDIYEDEAKEKLIIKYLNYNEIELTAYLPFELYDLIKYDSEIIIGNNSDNGGVEIMEIGYVIENDTFEITLKTDLMLLPGEKKECIFKYGVRENITFIPVEAVLNDGASHYVTMFDVNHKPYRRDIVVGEIFTVNQNGIILQYYEIISGLEEGEEAYAPSPW